MNLTQLTFVIFWAVATRGNMDLAKGWTIEKLSETSDLVIVARMTNSGDAVTDNPPNDSSVGVITSFDVSAVLKGKLSGGKAIKLFHFRQKEGTRIVNGPRFVSFNKDPITIKTDHGASFLLSQPDYVLFLKARKDGFYECVSGQNDPESSVKQMVPMLDLAN